MMGPNGADWRERRELWGPNKQGPDVLLHMSCLLDAWSKRVMACPSHWRRLNWSYHNRLDVISAFEELQNIGKNRGWRRKTEIELVCWDAKSWKLFRSRAVKIWVSLYQLYHWSHCSQENQTFSFSSTSQPEICPQFRAWRIYNNSLGLQSLPWDFPIILCNWAFSLSLSTSAQGAGCFLDPFSGHRST